ncbi:dipeptide/oligopeptide/nickel ABC transporter permease/ATP-binding protein [Saccharomonospora sp. NPDC046836]|uniref:dipeptide/oligopeptide/nickel ABC transporter permease/ATP-binding protein n=1 Tax=Saccharomonospora sp. NPDC046836 TaxID=3156921 RepID=UPI0033D699FD
MTIPGPDVISAPQAERHRRRHGAFRRLLRKPLGLSALVVLVGVVVLGLLEPVLSTHAPMSSDLAYTNASLGTPGWPLGGDQFGRDIWARVLGSINVSVISAVIGAGVGVVIGTVFGLIAGYVGRRTDAITSWVFNLLIAFPSLVLVIVLYPVVGSSYQGMMAIFGLFLSTGIFRLVRNLVITVRNELYVDAARVSGLSNLRIVGRHVLFAVRGPIIIATAFLASSAIGVQAGLAFLGFGSTQIPSFGAMVNDAFLNLYRDPVQLVWPAGFLALLTGSLVILGNSYRDVLAAPQDTVRSRRRTQEAIVTRDVPNEDAQPPMAGALLSVRGLRVRYPHVDGSFKEVVRGVSLDVQSGEMVGLVGESGSGKTQTAFSILGLLPKEGRVAADAMELLGESLLDKDARAMRAVRRHLVSYIPQEPMANLDPAFTVGSQLVEGLRGRMSRREAVDEVKGLLARVGIPDPERTFRSYPYQISGGMAQRVLIAGAVASKPKLLIADEPTTALDVTVQAEILDLLRDLQEESGMGVLLVTHNFGVVADLCDRVAVMRSGEIVETGEVRTIFHRPSHPYTQELIGSILDEESVREDDIAEPRPDMVSTKEQP